MEAPATTKAISISIGECEIDLVQKKGGFVSALTPNGKKSEFMFEYDQAFRLTDTLHTRQYEDNSTGRRITEIFIRRKHLSGSITGKTEDIIPVLKITSS